MKKPQAPYSSVIVIDDNPGNGNLLKYILLSLNYAEEVLIYSCPLKALESLSTNDIQKFPELIFLDLNNGIKAIQFINLFNEIPKKFTSHVKIILATSPENHMQVLDCKEEIRIEPISKPIKGSDLAQALFNLSLSKRREKAY
jgi:CheY-like chemotaxis protein